jgi:hypothetical protein
MIGGGEAAKKKGGEIGMEGKGADEVIFEREKKQENVDELQVYTATLVETLNQSRVLSGIRVQREAEGALMGA